jgi:trehalose utilization protein
MRVTVWGEGFLDVESLAEGDPGPLNYAGYVAEARRIYPEDVHEEIATALREQLGDSASVRAATLTDPELGLGEDMLAQTDVLLWWSHVKHHLIPDPLVERLWQRVREGMGLIVLHAGIESKLFRKLMGTSCLIGGWRQSDDWEAVWTVAPAHPIAEGLPGVFTIPHEEAYAEFFDIPTPDELVFVSSFRGGEIFRSGCCFTRGNGRIFYFRPGHESHPTFHLPHVRVLLANATRWAARGSEATTPLRSMTPANDAQNADAAKRMEMLEGWVHDPAIPGPSR